MRRLLPTVERTILVELTLNLVVVTGVVTGVFFIVSVLQFMIRHADLPMDAILTVLPHLLLALFNWTVPSSLLLATIMTYGRMGEDQEVTALRACGVPLYHVLLPAIFVGVVASGLSYEVEVSLQHTRFRGIGDVVGDPEELHARSASQATTFA